MPVEQQDVPIVDEWIGTLHGPEAFHPLGSSTQAVATALFLVMLGLAMAIDLVSVRDSGNTHAQDKQEVSMTPTTAIGGIIEIPSNHSVDETVSRLKSILQSKGITLFALVDHSGEAGKVGMKMPPTKLLIFGDPKAGTPLMLGRTQHRH